MPRPRRIDPGASRPRPRPKITGTKVTRHRILQTNRETVKIELIADLVQNKVPKVVAERYAEMFLKKHYDPKK